MAVARIIHPSAGWTDELMSAEGTIPVVQLSGLTVVRVSAQA